MPHIVGQERQIQGHSVPGDLRIEVTNRRPRFPEFHPQASRRLRSTGIECKHSRFGDKSLHPSSFLLPSTTKYTLEQFRFHNCRDPYAFPGEDGGRLSGTKQKDNRRRIEKDQNSSKLRGVVIVCGSRSKTTGSSRNSAANSPSVLSCGRIRTSPSTCSKITSSAPPNHSLGIRTAKLRPLAKTLAVLIVISCHMTMVTSSKG